MTTRRSREAFDRACRVIPGGVNSPARAFGAVGGSPPFIARGEGPFLFDIDGNQYLDFVGSWGPLILGHAHPKVIRAVEETARLLRVSRQSVIRLLSHRPIGVKIGRHWRVLGAALLNLPGPDAEGEEARADPATPARAGSAAGQHGGRDGGSGDGSRQGHGAGRRRTPLAAA